jgi:hypothetical protein
VRLPELDEKAVELQPLPIVGLSNPVPTVGRVLTGCVTGTQTIHVKRDLLEMTMVRCDGPECHDNPFGAQPFPPKCHVFKYWKLSNVSVCRILSVTNKAIIYT